MFDLDFPTVCTVGDKVISNIDVSGPLAAGCSAILFQKDSTFVVLIHNTIIDVVALRIEKITRPEYLTENVAKDTFKGSLFDCQENVSHYTYYCLNNQCEY